MWRPFRRRNKFWFRVDDGIQILEGIRTEKALELSLTFGSEKITMPIKHETAVQLAQWMQRQYLNRRQDNVIYLDGALPLPPGTRDPGTGPGESG